ncbi:MAG TPA: DUF1232 domain-containing protein [bacterium]|nr:DUF1232 domain-containing protein [bacterium]
MDRPNTTTPLGTIVSTALAIMYGLSPVDIVPDVIPLLGLLDDFLVIPALLLLAYAIYTRAQRRQPVIIEHPDNPQLPNDR